MEWYEAAPLRWQAEQKLAQSLLEGVEAGIDDQGRGFLRGTLRVLSQHGHEHTACKIRIVYPPRFPERGRVPAVYLESHQHWWKGPDTHIGEDGKLCPFVPGESGIDCSHPDSLADLIACLRVFLFKEYLYQRELAIGLLTDRPAVWPGPARAHGIAGIWEAIHEAGWMGAQRTMSLRERPEVQAVSPAENIKGVNVTAMSSRNGNLDTYFKIFTGVQEQIRFADSKAVFVAGGLWFVSFTLFVFTTP